MQDVLTVQASGPRSTHLNVPGAPLVERKDRKGTHGQVEAVSSDGKAVTVFWLGKGTRSIVGAENLRPVKGSAA